MPGVPTFRGCEACHRQKKKCDEKQPACSRCARLRIACEGRGNVRFKFVHNNAPMPLVKKAPTAKSKERKKGREIAIRSLLPSPVSITITSDVARAASAFVSVLQVTDPRYDITCYGGWVLDLPRRLGVNDALDASVQALSAAFPSIHTKNITCKALGTYVKALEVLRMHLADTKKAREPETLCAIYLIMVCQGWIGSTAYEETAHITGMAYLLQSSKPTQELEAFEKAVHRTIGVSIILESFCNPNIELGKLQESLRASEGPRVLTKSDGTRFPSLDIMFLARIPDYLRCPIENISHIRTDYETLKTDSLEMYKQMKEIERALFAIEGSSISPDPILMRRYTMVQTGYGLLLGLSACFSAILSVFEPADQTMACEVQGQIDLILQFADYVNASRPLGASYMGLPLLTAWAATPMGPRRRHIEEVMNIYLSDFPSISWTAQGRRLQDVFHRVALSRVEVIA